MKVGFVSTYLPKQCGIATYTDYLIGGLRKVSEELDMRVIAETGAEPLKEDRFTVDVPWDRNEDYVKQILGSIDGEDILHIQHEYGIYGFDERLPELLTALKGRIKTIVTIHCVRPAQFSERGDVDEKYAGRIAELANRVIVHLDSQKSILTRLGVKEGKIRVIPHGTEITDEPRTASRERLSLPQEPWILLMFGFVKKHKCLHTVLEALARILEKRDDVYFFIGGGVAPNPKEKDREYAEYINRRIDELGVRDNVIYENKFFPNEDVPYLFGASDIVLFPYYEEDRSASGSMHLSLGARKLVIASRIPKFEELREVCDELLILPYNVDGLERLILRLIEDEKFRNFIFDRTEVFRRRTSWPEVAKMHISVYRELL